MSEKIQRLQDIKFASESMRHDLNRLCDNLKLCVMEHMGDGFADLYEKADAVLAQAEDLNAQVQEQLQTIKITGR